MICLVIHVVVKCYISLVAYSVTSIEVVASSVSQDRFALTLLIWLLENRFYSIVIVPEIYNIFLIINLVFYGSCKLLNSVECTQETVLINLFPVFPY